MPFQKQGGLDAALHFLDNQWNGSGESELFTHVTRQMLHMVAEYTGDGKYLYYADLLPAESEAAKIGAAFLPTGSVAKREPTELLHTWTVAPIPLGAREYYRITALPEQSFFGLSWRDSVHKDGDFLAFNGFNEGYRTPYKLLSLCALRLNGFEVLNGFGNYVQIYRDNTTEPKIPMQGLCYGYGQVGDSAFFAGGVPEHSFGAWRRDLLLRKRSFVLLADTVTAATQGPALDVAINFQTANTFRKDPADREKLLMNGMIISANQTRLSTNREFDVSPGKQQSLFHAAQQGDRAIMEFSLNQPFHGSLQLNLAANNMCAAALNVILDGKVLASNVPYFSSDGFFRSRSVLLEALTLDAKTHRLELEVVSPSAEKDTAWIVIRNLSLQPADGRVVSLTTAGAEQFIRSGDNAVARRKIPADPARPVTTFTIIAPEHAKQRIRAVPDGDQGGRLFFPEPALAFCGTRREIGTGNLILLEKDRITGSGVTRLTDQLDAEKPLDIEWKFTGPCRLHGAPGTVYQLQGKRFVLPDSGSSEHFVQPASRDTWTRLLQDFTPPKSDAKQERVAPQKVSLKTFAALPSKIVSVKKTANGLLLVGAGKQLLVLDENGHTKHAFDAGSEVTAVAALPGLFLAGTRDSQIVAFDENSRIRWQRNSKLAPKPELLQRNYWNKVTYPGIFSMETSGNRIYVGSSCTMEVFDENGTLCGRYFQPWGPIRSMVFIRSPQGSMQVVGVRHSTAHNADMWTLDTATGENRTSFKGNVSGFTYLRGWLSFYRTKAMVADFNGDGQEELLTDLQGMYLGMHLYDAAGRPKAQVSFGPGDKLKSRVFSDWTAGDITGDALPEIVLVSTEHRLVVLNSALQPLWSRDLPFRPEHVTILGRNILVLGNKNIAWFNGNGDRLAYQQLDAPISGVTAVASGAVLHVGKELRMLPLPQHQAQIQ